MTSTAQQHPPGSPEAFLATCQPLGFKPNDVNLIAEARAILVKHGASVLHLEAFDNNFHIKTGAGMTTEIQCYKLNMFIDAQYSALAGDISQHRQYIISGVEATKWLQMMDVYHAPTMLKLGLPVPM